MNGRWWCSWCLRWVTAVRHEPSGALYCTVCGNRVR